MIASDLDLLEISEGGLCFGLIDGQPRLAVGTILEEVTLTIEGQTIAGSLRVAHVTEEFSAGTICGAEFRPATEDDEKRVADILASLASRTPPRLVE